MSETGIPSNHVVLHEELGISDEDPYQSVRYLGHGGSGSVDEVRRKGDATQQCFARKQILLRGGSRRQHMIEELKQEARTIQRLRHRHIIRLFGTYTKGKVFGIVMDPVAETDLQELLNHVDGMEYNKEKQDLIETILRWPGCLLRAIDYIHEMRVKHRDIKPSNILIKGKDVYLTDFGISRVVPEGHTTGTDGPTAMTRAYAAPEALKDGARRGRAVDIFSLGCIFFEMEMITWGYVSRLESFRRRLALTTGSCVFAENQTNILGFFAAVWDFWYRDIAIGRGADKNIRLPLDLADLSFLMLDPNPETRITSRQLISLISAPGDRLNRINELSCDRCRNTTPYRDLNIPLHSRFKDVGAFLKLNEEGFVPPDWETAKRKWLEHHMWW